MRQHSCECKRGQLGYVFDSAGSDLGFPRVGAEGEREGWLCLT